MHHHARRLDIGIDLNSSRTSTTIPAVPRRQIVSLTFLFEGGLFVAALILGVLTGDRFWDDAVVTGRAVLLAVGLTLPLFVVMGIGVQFSLPLFNRIRQDIDHILPLFSKCTIPDLLIIGALAGICEEALFRGVLQPFAAGYIGPVPALIVVSLLFGLVHPVSFAYVVFAFGMGIYLGAVQIWLDNILVPMAIHGLYDFVALVFLCRVYARNPSLEEAK